MKKKENDKENRYKKCPCGVLNKFQFLYRII